MLPPNYLFANHTHRHTRAYTQIYIYIYIYIYSIRRYQGMELRPLLRLGVVAIEKGAFVSPSTTVANFTYLALNSA